MNIRWTMLGQLVAVAVAAVLLGLKFGPTVGIATGLIGYALAPFNPDEPQ